MKTKTKKADKIQESITEAGAKSIARDFNIPVKQIKQAFNCYDNCVISGEAETMSISRMGMLFRQCVTGSSEVMDGLVWNEIAREFRENYNKYKRNQRSVMKVKLTADEVIQQIASALSQADGKFIEKLANKILSNPVKHKGHSVFEQEDE